jgi:hypothetical protein
MRKILSFIFTALLVAMIVICLQVAYEGYWEMTHPDATCERKCKEVFSKGSFYVKDGGVCVCTDGRKSAPSFIPKKQEAI